MLKQKKKMDLQPSDLETALEVKRGQRKLRDLPDDERIRVASVLSRTTTTQFARMAQAKLFPKQPTYKHSRTRS